MREIGVRELKTHLSEVLRDVGQGEELRVTVRGEAVADIVPVDEGRGTDDRLGALVSAGKVTPPSRPRPEHPPRLAISTRAASAAVVADREPDR
jgi:prevent-host-death family protein